MFRGRDLRGPLFYLPLLPFLALASCGGDTTPTGTPPPSGDGGNGSGSDPGGAAGPPTGSDPGTQPPPTSIDRLEIDPGTGGNFLENFPLGSVISGGVVKDGIPALTDPIFVALNSRDADYVLETDIVLGLYINGEAKAYPHNIGWWHEIVNDEVGGEPVVVTLCPLTGTGMVFDGNGEDGRIRLGVSGRLFNNNLIMYDRRDQAPGETNYPQMLGKGVSGPRNGEELKLIPVVETTWRYWKQLPPATTVVSSRTGFSRSYVTYPYGTYRDPTAPPSYSITPSIDDNVRANLLDWKQLTLGVRFGEMAKGYPFDLMGTQAAINDEIDGNPILVVWYADELMAVPFSRNVGGQTLTFERITSNNAIYPFLLKDNETGTTWNLKGEALAGGELEGEVLEQIPSHNAFWFAWTTFWQNTGVY